MITVTSRGMTCWADSYRQVGYGGIIFLSIFGDRNAVRAAWASLFSRKKWEGINVGDNHARCTEGAHYSTISSPIGKGSLHAMVLHSSMTRQASTFDTSFFQAGPDGAVRFFDRFSQMCAVPLRPEWREVIWQMGIEAKLIKPLAGFGLDIHEITTETKEWAPLVKDAVLDGRLR